MAESPTDGSGAGLKTSPMSTRPSVIRSTTDADNASTTLTVPFGKELRKDLTEWDREIALRWWGVDQG